MHRVLLIGDPMTDTNVYCRVRDQICREAPIPILDIVSETHCAGGALNVKANLEALGLQVEFITTSTESLKQRVWVGDRLICRYDRDGNGLGVSPFPAIQVLGFDALVISDYQKGLFRKPDEARRFLAGVWQAPQRPPIFVDTKSEFPGRTFGGADFIFPSVSEWPRVEPDVKEFKHVVRKDGANGCYIDGVHVSTEPLHGADPVGAGDTFLAGFVWAYLEHCSQQGSREDGISCLTASAQAANKAARIVCGKRGTSVATLEELLAS